MTNIELLKEVIKDAIEEVYGELNNLGCYKNNNWLSTLDIYDIVCDAIDNNDDLIIED